MSCVATFRIDIAAMLAENASLDILSFRRSNQSKAEEYVTIFTILEHNATLKILGCVTLSCVFG
jgi:hypothetical protein